jgi:chromosome segregation ATPase
MERLRSEISRLEAENQNYEILIEEKDRTIKLVTQNLEKKSKEHAYLTDENNTFRQTLSKTLILNKVIAAQNEKFKEKIDELKEEKSQMEEEVSKLIDLLKEHEAEKQNDSGKYFDNTTNPFSLNNQD